MSDRNQFPEWITYCLAGLFLFAAYGYVGKQDYVAEMEMHCASKDLVFDESLDACVNPRNQRKAK